jgi:diguanylate cyclase (GGDEF)-like protein/PAS domain S-box-containing protein
MAVRTTPTRLMFDVDTSAILEQQFANAERVVNGVRICVLGALGVAALLYAPHLTPQLNVTNIAVLAPILAWAIGQHLVFHRQTRNWPPLSLVNAMIDITAVSTLLVGYGLFGAPDLAVKSPIFGAYFVVLAARPFTGSAGRTALAACVVGTQYAIVVAFFVGSGRLELYADPMIAITASGTSLVDEFAKTLLLVVAGIVATYATAWNERTLRQAVTARRSSEARFRAVFEHSAVGIALLDDDAAMIESNPAFGAMLGANDVQLANWNLHDLALGSNGDAARDQIRQVSEGTVANATTELRYHRQDGEMGWGSLTISRAEGADDVKVIALLQDVTARKALEAKLLRQAFYDALTGLANRALFRDRVEHALSRATRDREHIAVMFLDLDNFKSVNDTLGHAAGDELLSIIAGRLLNATRGCDTVARLGGDEFAVLLENVRGDADTIIVAERIVHALSTQVDLAAGNTVRATSSIGITRAGPDDSVEELLRNADVAMYAAKNGSRGGFVFFDPAMHTALVARVTLEVDLRRALERQELWVAYQPIVELESNEVLAIEALVRWQHPERGLILPDEFIPLAEETGLIIPLGQFVLREACHRAAEWNARREDGRRFSITVNVSSRQLQVPGLAADVAATLASSGLDASLLILEITESVIMQQSETILMRLRELKALGIRLAIDDFGTGYSSLSYLQQFPVDILKIDRSFTSGLMRGANDDALARTIIALGDLLTMHTVAEGIEHPEQHSRLRDLGCTYGQGYLFSKPLGAKEMDRLLTRGLAGLTGEQPVVLSETKA